MHIDELSKSMKMPETLMQSKKISLQESHKIYENRDFPTANKDVFDEVDLKNTWRMLSLSLKFY